jgi:LacI family transcriptional regulator
MTRRITMSDVAREAGVSRMTVSRVVNDKGEISAATRQRVLDVIERLGYRPSSIARGLATQRSRTLGLVVPDIANPFFSAVARGAENEACAHGYSVFLCNTNEDTQRELSVLQSLEEKRVDGIVLCSSRLDPDELRPALAHHAAVVLTNMRIDEYHTGLVMVDDESGGQAATQHLLRTGRRAIGFLAGPPKSQSGHKRQLGYRAALQAAGLEYNADWVRHCSPKVQGGLQTTRQLLDDHPELSALFCYNDLVAIGALQACADLGRRVPDDLAIVGFDDISLAALVTPSLTTCRVPRYELGAHSMRLLLNHINGCVDECEEILLQPELVVRASAP